MHGDRRLLHSIATRVLLRHLTRAGIPRVTVAQAVTRAAEGIDLSYAEGGAITTIKVVADPYLGVDPLKIADRALSLYRAASDAFGLEVTSDTASRAPGWAMGSAADELYYYRLAVGQTPEDAASLMREPDEVFFSEIAIERDDLYVIPMQAIRSWFTANADRFTPRPVLTEGRTAWYRIVPIAEVEQGVRGVRHVGRVFPGLTRG